LPDSAGTASGNAGVQDFPRLPGLYGILGLGSRGLVWSALMGEFLAASIVGEPWPLEMDLARAIDPARFLFRAKNAPTERRAQK
jgi:tRNA 5-methylaminomethyl-2-thiouridine biosynthesis bifunctional protein